MARILRRLHSLPAPAFPMGRLDPFVRVAERIDAAEFLPPEDRKWLRGRLSDLELAWADMSPDLSSCVIHGDAWPVHQASRLSEKEVSSLPMRLQLVG
ncbi:aminoglycoside phosphotransferase family protein [Streptosporangium sp. KLBMP 9127]|nr:aminoglycoside phosphotransferase family protein [Streptosporangium sp. KLBMP 9127]